MRARPLALLALAPTVAQAQAPAPVAKAPATPLQSRVEALVVLFAGGGDFEADFADRFRAAISPEQMAVVTAKLRDQFGKPLAIERVQATGAWLADVTLGFDHGTASITLQIEPTAPYRIIGLRITGTQYRDDTFAHIAADLRALPGSVGFGVYALEGRGPRPVIEVNAGGVAPIGSSFKLWVLAEAVRQVRTGMRRWSDVVTLGPRSLPSGQMQAWPAGAPVTLQTLATMMVSISDNTATDTLMATLARARVDAMVATVGVADPARTLPLLTTREAAAIKADPTLLAAWTRSGVAGRRTLLLANRAKIAAMPLDVAMFDGAPVAPDGVEWFASPRDMARTLDWLRMHGDGPTQAMLAINPGIAPGSARAFGYAGYKGGSEPGVIAMNHLLNTRDGHWYAVTGNWHRGDAAVDDAAFAAIMARAVALVAR
ncbi:serine hydrolase [Sphingomonas sp.]|uniref:serine hydrolase n=1 Tax=Sphingomonas sp. TaxID=28214 RepID=UPI0035BBFABE